MHPTVVSVTMAAAAGFMLAAALAGPAAAADKRLLLSPNGDHWSTLLDQPILPASAAIVPGSSVSGTLWVRNNSPEPTTLSIAALAVRGNEQLQRYLDIILTASGLSSGPVSLHDNQGCVEVMDEISLAPGEDLRLDVALVMDIQAPNSTMKKVAVVDMKFLLEPATAGSAVGGSICGDSVGTVVPGLDPTTPVFPSPSPSTTPPAISSGTDRPGPSPTAGVEAVDGSGNENWFNDLADTGAQAIPALAAVGTGLLVLGTVLARTSRRKGTGKLTAQRTSPASSASRRSSYLPSRSA